MNALTKPVKNSLVMIGVPLAVYLLFFGMTRAAGNRDFGVGADFQTILYNMVYSGFIALAMSYNLTSGRFNFAVGATLILSLIAGGTLAKSWNAGPVAFAALVIGFGLLCGLVSGLMYITLKLPPMVTSLGVAMIFEAVGFSLNASKGIKLIGKFQMLIWGVPPYSLLLLGAALVLLIYLLNFTRFGYNCRSLQAGQKNAVEAGVNEKKNAVFCYLIEGGLMACAGVLYLCKYGYIAPQSGLGSSSFMMGAFLPLFVGGALAKYSERNIGVVAGAFIQACISSGLVKMGISSSMKTVVDGTIVLLFLIYLSNSYKIGLNNLYKRKKEQALAELAAGK
jgi:ribose transport system permease protein